MNKIDLINPLKWFRKETRVDDLISETTDSLMDLGMVQEDVIELPEDFVMGNPTCLIIDDNYGQVQVLKDDIEYVLNHYGIANVNVLPIHGNMGAFDVNDLLYKYNDKLKIKYVIADLTIGGSQRINNENVKLNGVDVVGFLKKYEEDLKIIIYTGNNLNRYIENNAKIANKFKVITGDDIDNYLIIKRELTINERRRAIALRLFDKKS